jgi:hypothetical protein
MPKQIQELESRFRSARECLLSSKIEAIQEGVEHLEAARVGMEHLASTPQSREIREAVALLRPELRRIERLAEHGLRFYAGWAGMLASAFAGYTPDGATAPLTARGHVCVEG